MIDDRDLTHGENHVEVARREVRHADRQAFPMLDLTQLSNYLTNFKQISILDSNFTELVLLSTKAKFRNQILVGKLLTRSIRCTFLCTAPTSKFQQVFAT